MAQFCSTGINTPTRTTDTRAESRFPIDAACRFWWTGSSDEPVSACGRTRDVSSHGIFITSSTLPPAGAVIMVEIDLPRFSQPQPETPFLLLTAEGFVLRPHREGDGFAARLTHSNFTSQQD